MEIAKLTSKGQITIPKAVRNELGVDTGDKLIFIKYDNGFLMCNGADFNVNAVAEEEVQVAELPPFRSVSPSPAPRAVKRVPDYYYDDEEEVVERKPKKDKEKDKDKDKAKDKKKKKKKKK